MSRLTQTTAPRTARLGARRGVPLALLASTAVLLVPASGDGANTAAAAGASQPALRSDGGPEETGVAAALGPPRAASAPDECRIAAAIAKGARLRPRTGPDERATAAAIVAGR